MAGTELPSLDLNLEMASAKYGKTSQIQVIFRNVDESYLVGVDVPCSYTISGSLEVTSRDWVGLYRVGWRTQSDYFYYDWSPLPQDYQKGTDTENKVIFPAHKLPQEDGEFYQFCYITSAGQVRGASTPFQFRLQSVDDLIEIEDENGELLVIRTKTALLEEKLKKANDVKLQLRQQLQAVENERNLSLISERQLQKKLLKQKEEEEMMNEKLGEAAYVTHEQLQQIEHLQSCIDAFQEKTEVLNQEKTSMEKRLDENDAYIVSLQEKIKTLVNEKDNLTGRVKNMEEEAEKLQKLVPETDKLKTQLMEREISNAGMKKEVERMEKEIHEQQMILKNQITTNMADKETIECLSERFHNAEDKLEAAEHCKKMLNEEVLTLKQAFEKMSSNLEESKATTDCAKKTLQLTLQNLNSDIQKLENERSQMEDQLDVANYEIKSKSKEIDDLNEELDVAAGTKTEAEGSLYALQMAQDTLKERYAKMEKKCEGHSRALKQALGQIHALEMSDEDAKQEVVCLKERLVLAREAYMKKYIECENMETKLFKQKRGSLKRLDESSAENCNVSEPSSDATPKPDEQTQEMRKEIEKYYLKAKHYKQLYVKEKLKMDDRLRKLPEKDDDLNFVRDLWIKVRGPLDNDALEKSLSAEKSLNESAVLTKSSDDDSIDGSRSQVDGSRSQVEHHDSACHLNDPAEGQRSLPEVRDIHGNGQNQNHGVDEERFEDAPGEPQKTCPVCTFAFPQEATERDIMDHIDAHYCGAICPVCSKVFPVGYDQDAFACHVNDHFLE